MTVSARAVSDRATQPDPAQRVAALFQDGDLEDVCHRLFESYSRPVYIFFCRRGFTDEESRDLLQETFLKLFRGLASFRGQATVESYLFRIAANVWKNELRRQGAEKRGAKVLSLDRIHEEADHEEEFADPFRDPAPEPLDEIIDEERQALVDRAIDRLPSQMRQCLVLYVRQNLRYREIATVMGISLETVKSQIHQARRRLREALARYAAHPR